MAVSHRIALLLWSGVLQWSRVGINALIFLVLSRWLTLEEIGTIAAVQAPIIVLQSIFTNAIPDLIVQENNENQSRLSTLFWFSLFLGGSAYAVIWCLSPLIVEGIGDTVAFDYIYVSAIAVLLWAAASVFEGTLRKAVDTKSLGLKALISAVFAACIALLVVWLGGGAWAIVSFSVTTAAFAAVISIVLSTFRPTAKVDFGYLRGTLGKFTALAVRNIIAAATTPLLQFVVVVQLGSAAGGKFQIAARLFTLVDAVAVTPVRFLVMPIFARSDADRAVLAKRLTSAISAGSVIAAPAYFGLIAIAPALLPILLGATNGSDSILVVQLMAMYGPFAILLGVVTQAMLGRGYLWLVLARMLLTYLFAVFPAVWASQYSVEAMACVYAIASGTVGGLLGLSIARSLFGTRTTVLLSAWLRPVLAGAGLLLVPEVLRMIGIMDNYSLIIGLTLACPVLYFAMLSVIARPQLRSLLAVARGDTEFKRGQSSVI